jgi:hypothetical protein
MLIVYSFLYNYKILPIICRLRSVAPYG